MQVLSTTALRRPFLDASQSTSRDSLADSNPRRLLFCFSPLDCTPDIPYILASSPDATTYLSSLRSVKESRSCSCAIISKHLERSQGRGGTKFDTMISHAFY